MLITEGALFILIFMSVHICDLTSSYFTPHADVARSMVRKVLRPPLPTSLQLGSSLSAAWTIPKKGSLVSTLEKILLVCVHDNMKYWKGWRGQGGVILDPQI